MPVSRISLSFTFVHCFQKCFIHLSPQQLFHFFFINHPGLQSVKWIGGQFRCDCFYLLGPVRPADSTAIFISKLCTSALSWSIIVLSESIKSIFSFSSKSQSQYSESVLSTVGPTTSRPILTSKLSDCQPFTGGIIGFQSLFSVLVTPLQSQFSETKVLYQIRELISLNYWFVQSSELTIWKIFMWYWSMITDVFQTN